MEPEKPVSSRQSLVLDLPPSCLQFSRKHPDYFVVGTYNLQKDTVSTESPPDDTPDVDAPTEKKSQSRNGSLLLFKIGAGVDDELYVVSDAIAMANAHANQSTKDLWCRQYPNHLHYSI